MSHFNKAQPSKYQTPDTTNLAGGRAFGMGMLKEIITILLTSFLRDKFYEKADDTTTRLCNLIAKVQKEEDKKMLAKAIIYARTVFGMRSITHVAAAELSKYIGGLSWSAEFFNQVVYRPDDMTEIMSYCKSKKYKYSAALKKGFARAFNKFTGYQLGRYRSEDKAVKLVDVVNVCHPVISPQTKSAGRGFGEIEEPQHFDARYQAVKLLMKGELKQEETWEAMLSAAGSEAGKKQAVWETLLRERKLGYLALLRNLRNIIQQAPVCVPMAVESLTSEAFIKKSLILPFQYMTAFEEIKALGQTSVEARLVMTGIAKAIDISLANVPLFEGSTLVVLDVSGSMTSISGSGRGKGTPQTPAQIGALFAAVLVKANNADFMTFDTDARYQTLNTFNPIITIAQDIRFSGGGTDLKSIFHRAVKKYDRIIILSDMQGWNSEVLDYGFASVKKPGGPIEAAKIYRKKWSADPLIYSFDLNGYGSLQFHQDRTFLLSGFSDKTLQTMQYLEKDPDALITEINKIEL